MKVSDIKPNPNNPRVIRDQKFERLCKSITEFPKMMQLRPIVTDADGVVLGGNMRLRALQHLKLTEIPDSWVRRADDLTEDEKRRFIISDNASFGEWDYDQLANEWDSNELTDWGVDVPEWQTQAEAKEDDYQIPDEIKTDIVVGDLFEIGVHRLLCGDSTDSDAVAKLMNGEKADMVFTDPPYDMQMTGGYKGYAAKAMRKVEKDIEFISKFDPSEFLDILPIVFESKKMNAYIFCNKDLVPKYLNFAIESGYSFNILFWKKPNCVPLCDSHYPDVEYLILLRKSAIWNNSLIGVNYSRCLEYGKLKGLHPTMKPIELIGNEIQISSFQNSIVSDFFLGSGSTMVAAHQLNRRCYGMEIEPKYCQVIIDRMLKLDPSLEVKRNGQPYVTTENKQ